MSSQNEFPVVFEILKSFLKPYEEKLIVKVDTAENYSLDGPYSGKWKKELFFGAAQVTKNYVSFHLMPVYMYPDLLKNTSPSSGNTCRENPALISRRAKNPCSMS